MRRFLLLAVLATLPAVAQTLTPGGPANTFQMAPYVSGLGQLTDFRFLPDGRVVMTEKTGAVKVRRTDGSVVTAGSFTVDSDSEKGLLGVEVDPQFATNTFLYFYASDGPSTANKHRVSKVRLKPDNFLDCTGSCSTAQGSVQVLLQNLRGPANHDGGGLAIGPDGKLYVGVGDTGANSGLPPGGTITNYIGTCLTTANGKVLRINLDGTIPADNPLAAAGTRVPACDGSPGSAPDPSNVTGIPRAEIWSWGFRNPFRFWFDAQTGRLWVGDVGEVSYEEVDLVTKGQHYGWPWREGAFGHPVTTCDNLGANGGGADCVEPAYFCAHAGAAGNADGSCQSITGGVFVDSPAWPAPYRGRYFFGDNANGNVWTLTPNAARDGFVPGPRSDFGTGFPHASPLPGRTGWEPLRWRPRREHPRHLPAHGSGRRDAGCWGPRRGFSRRRSARCRPARGRRSAVRRGAHPVRRWHSPGRPARAALRSRGPTPAGPATRARRSAHPPRTCPGTAGQRR